MARIRNPRFAPEFLERRLSPSSFGMAPGAAEVSPARDLQREAPLPRDGDGDPIPDPYPEEEPGQDIPV